MSAKIVNNLPRPLARKAAQVRGKKGPAAGRGDRRGNVRLRQSRTISTPRSLGAVLRASMPTPGAGAERCRRGDWLTACLAPCRRAPRKPSATKWPKWGRSSAPMSRTRRKPIIAVARQLAADRRNHARRQERRLCLMPVSAGAVDQHVSNAPKWLSPTALPHRGCAADSTRSKSDDPMNAGLPTDRKLPPRHLRSNAAACSAVASRGKLCKLKPSEELAR